MLSEAVKAVIGIVSPEGEVAVKMFTVGTVVSTTTVTGIANAEETLPEASFAQGYRV